MRDDKSGTLESKEFQILKALKLVLTDVVKDTATQPGLKHPLSERTIEGIRQCLKLISARERELIEGAGKSMDMRPYYADEPKIFFRAPGTNHIKGKATLVNLSEKLRANSEEGFNEAAKSTTANLDQQLTLFKDKVKERPAEYKVVHSPGYSGGGSIDLIALAIMLGLGGFFL